MPASEVATDVQTTLEPGDDKLPKASELLGRSRETEMARLFPNPKRNAGEETCVITVEVVEDKSANRVAGMGRIGDG